MPTYELAPGDLAFMDTFGGLVACRILATDHSGVIPVAHVLVTAHSNRFYARGTDLFVNELHIVARDSVRGDRIIGTTHLA